MITDKDKTAIEKAKQQIQEQIIETEKDNLGLDADSSSAVISTAKTSFDPFFDEDRISPLDEK